MVQEQRRIVTRLTKAGLTYTAKSGKRLNRIGLGRNQQRSKQARKQASKQASEETGLVLQGLHHCTALLARQSITAMQALHDIKTLRPGLLHLPLPSLQYYRNIASAYKTKFIALQFIQYDQVLNAICNIHQNTRFHIT